MTYKELAKIISELPKQRQNEDVTFVCSNGEIHKAEDFLAADQIINEDLSDEVVSSLHEDHFVLL